jgi:hypothetical protein
MPRIYKKDELHTGEKRVLQVLGPVFPYGLTYREIQKQTGLGRKSVQLALGRENHDLQPKAYGSGLIHRGLAMLESRFNLGWTTEWRYSLTPQGKELYEGLREAKDGHPALPSS